jgi:hypothetical protein
MPNDKPKRLPDEEDDDPKIEDDPNDELLWDDGDPADRRKDPLRAP